MIRLRRRILRDAADQPFDVVAGDLVKRPLAKCGALHVLFKGSGRLGEVFGAHRAPALVGRALCEIPIDCRRKRIFLAGLLGLGPASVLLLPVAPLLNWMRPSPRLGHAPPGQLTRVGDVLDLCQRPELLPDQLAVYAIEGLPRLPAGVGDAQPEARQLRVPHFDPAAWRRLQVVDRGLRELQRRHLMVLWVASGSARDVLWDTLYKAFHTIA